MVAFAQSEQSISCQPRSGEHPFTSELRRRSEERRRLRRDAFVMTKQPAESFVADDLLTVRKWLIDDWPGTCERPVLQRLVRSQLVVVVQIRSDQIVEVLLAKNGEEIQALGFNRSNPSFDKSIFVRCLGCRRLDLTVDILEDLIKL